VGVDGSPSGRDAVVLGSVLARATGAEVMLIAVYEEPLLEPVIPGEMGWRSMQRQARTMLAATRDALAPEARVVLQSDVLVWRALSRVARRERRDLLVVGSGRRSGEGRVGLGESAQELLWQLECPLAIAPRGMEHRDEPQIARIGVGFDGRPEARAALELAASIAPAAGAQLEVRGAVGDRVSGELTTEQVAPGGEAIVSNRAKSLRDQALDVTRAAGAQARVAVYPAVPADELWELGDAVDLLVIGSSRRGPPGRISLGSTGRAVVEGAPCPVLVVPRVR
jgi:nucleotide-binding universal stress UspA family protein